jgi:Cu/Zn superoxide dismutase
MTPSLRWMLAAAVLALSGTGPSAARAAGPVTVQLTPQNNSGESGTATFTEQGAKTKVTVAVTGAPAGVAQPLHVHKGTCAQLDPKPAYGLAALTDGKSETTIDVSLAALQAGGFAVNGHKSAAEVSTYVFCGNVPKPN